MSERLMVVGESLEWSINEVNYMCDLPFVSVFKFNFFFFYLQLIQSRVVMDLVVVEIVIGIQISNHLGL